MAAPEAADAARGPGGHRMPAAWSAIVRAALAEDLGDVGDVTSEAVVSSTATLVADIRFRESGVLCGREVFEAVYRELDEVVAVEWLVDEGALVAADQVVGRVSGPARAVLTGERTALDLLGHMSGIAGRTRAFVEAVSGTHVRIYDTRKTTPGLRVLDKYAVTVGGGANHRMGLFDQVLIKDNHLVVAGGVTAAVTAARARWAGSLAIEVEVETVADAVAAADAGADIIMLDNMSMDEIREAVAVVDGRAELEASGGVTLGTVREIAETGVDRIAVGALTDGDDTDVGLDAVSRDADESDPRRSAGRARGA